MERTPGERTQWEYVHVSVLATDAPAFIRSLNDAGARGWELVSVSHHNALASTILGVMRRPVEPLPDPDDHCEDWKPDPSGRFELRYWDGEAWTMRTRTAGIDHRDPPTGRIPAEVPQ